MKKLTYGLVIFTFILFLGLTFSYNPLMAKSTDEFDEGKDIFLNILTVNKEQYKIVKQIAGEKHNIQYLFENRKEIEEFKVNASFLDNILNMDLFIYNGFGYESWINDIIDISKSSKVSLINASRGIRPILSELKEESKENPYYLLGFNEYKIALHNIKTSLQEKDTKNRNYYEENYNNAIKELGEFLSYKKEELKQYSDYYIFTDTDNFDYLFKELGIEVKKIKANDVSSLNYNNYNEKTKFIFVYDKEENNLDEITKNTDLDFNYIALVTEGKDNILLSNVTQLIELIKNKTN